MRTIIAGSRTIRDITPLYEAIEDCGWTPTVVISGGARGIDSIGEWWAKQNNIIVEVYPANWSRFGRGAGKIRNAEMALKAEALIAIWDGYSKGTGHMIDCARANNLKIYVHLV
jgi:hypothetical protein